MSNNAISNEIDLDWLARNVHVWPAGDHQPWCYVYWKGGQRAVSGNCITVIQPCVRVEMSEWLARRAELQKKPSWAHAPEWAVYIAQSPKGHWEFFAVKPRAEGWWRHPIGEHSSANNASIRGAILGEWCDTLEKRPEEFNPFISIEDNQEQKMKQDNGWFERGELPPVGTVCLYVVSDRRSAEVEITAHAKLGLCFVEVGKSGENYVSKTAEPHRFRPIRTERDVLIEIISSNLSGTTGQIADAIIAAGFKMEAK